VHNAEGRDMTPKRRIPETVEDYIASFPLKVEKILRRIRRIILRAAPSARESISYRIPYYSLNGRLVYFAAFKSHIGLFPPVRGDAAIERAVAPYANPKGNLRFPLDQPIPYALIERIVRFRVKQNATSSGRTRATRRH
jgi:uncharacterized protein YdhG (YjbR/CyaY superfamily)